MTRGARRLLWLVGALLVLVGAAVWRAHAWADATIARHRRELEAEVSKLRTVSRARPALLEPVLPGNAYEVYGPVLASLAAPPVGPGGPSGFRFPRSGQYLAYLDEHRADLARWDEAIQMACEAPPPPVLGGPVLPLLHIQEASTAQTLLRNCVDEWLAAGRADEALSAALRLMVLGADVRRALSTHSNALGLSKMAAGRRLLELVLEQGSPSSASLARAARVLEGLEATRPSLMERQRADAAFERMARLGMAAGLDPERIPHDPVEGWRWLWSQRIYQATALDEARALRGSVLLGFARPLSTWRATTADLRMIDRKSAHPAFSGLADVGESFAWTFRFEALDRMGATLATVAVAVARFAADRGTAPASLSDLVPAYLQSVPVCPANGEPLRYSASPLRIWSIGGDGRDDGGRPVPPDADLDASGDFVFAVKPPR